MVTELQGVQTAQEQWDNFGIALYEDTNTLKLVRALLSYSVGIDVENLEQQRYVNDATGKALDRIGQLVQCVRKTGESDDKYRARIKAFGIANQSSGTFIDLLNATTAILDLDETDVTMSYIGGQATISVPTGSISNTSLTENEVVDALEKSVLAGHRIELQKVGENPFTVRNAGDVNSADNGLTSTGISTGGGLVEGV